jgi:hypothetical protein
MYKWGGFAPKLLVIGVCLFVQGVGLSIATVQPFNDWIAG